MIYRVSDACGRRDTPPESSHIRRVDPKALARFVAADVIPSHPPGFTICPWRLCSLDYSHDRSVHLVSIVGCEQSFRSRPTEAELLSWAWRHAGVLGRPGHTAGGWRARGSVKLTMDVCHPVRGETLGLAIGQKNLQDSIYRPSSDRCIDVPYPAAIKEIVPAVRMAITKYAASDRSASVCDRLVRARYAFKLVGWELPPPIGFTAEDWRNVLAEIERAHRVAA